jgi:hypothetical protein
VVAARSCSTGLAADFANSVHNVTSAARILGLRPASAGLPGTEGCRYVGFHVLSRSCIWLVTTDDITNRDEGLTPAALTAGS